MDWNKDWIFLSPTISPHPWPPSTPSPTRPLSTGSGRNSTFSSIKDPTSSLHWVSHDPLMVLMKLLFDQWKNDCRKKIWNWKIIFQRLVTFYVAALWVYYNLALIFFLSIESLESPFHFTHQLTMPPTVHHPTKPAPHQPTKPEFHQATIPPSNQLTKPPPHQATIPPSHHPTKPPSHQATTPPSNHHLTNPPSHLFATFIFFQPLPEAGETYEFRLSVKNHQGFGEAAVTTLKTPDDGGVVVWCGCCVEWLLCGVVVLRCGCCVVWCGCCVVWLLCGVVCLLWDGGVWLLCDADFVWCRGCVMFFLMWCGCCLVLCRFCGWLLFGVVSFLWVVVVWCCVVFVGGCCLVLCRFCGWLLFGVVSFCGWLLFGVIFIWCCVVFVMVVVDMVVFKIWFLCLLCYNDKTMWSLYGCFGVFVEAGCWMVSCGCYVVFL